MFTITLVCLLNNNVFFIFQSFQVKQQSYELLKPTYGKKSSNHHNDKIKVTGNCIPDNIDASKVDLTTTMGKPLCSEMNMTQEQKDLKFYGQVHWKLYYGSDGKVLPFDQMNALNSCVIMESPTLVFMNNKEIADSAVERQLHNPDTICLDAANSYYVPKGYIIKEIGNDGIGHQTVTLTK